MGGMIVVQPNSLVTRATLESCLEALHHFDCPSHHRELYARTESALLYLLRPDVLERVVCLHRPTFAPICADMVPDSGVCFLRCSTRGPADLASAMEQGKLDGSGLFLHLWDDALGLDYDAWLEVAERAPVIFIRLGESVQAESGRWQWAPLEGAYQEYAYSDVAAAFDALIAAAREAGDLERARRLHCWRHGVLE